MKITEILGTIISEMGNISKPTRKFIHELVLTIVSMKGRVNFLNMARWGYLSEKTLRRNFSKGFSFNYFNKLLIDKCLKDETFISAIDPSYIPKSGKKTYGLGKFWSGCLKKAVDGLEISCLCLISLTHQQAFTVSVRQTKATAGDEETRTNFYLEQVKMMADWLITKTKYLVGDGYFYKKKFIDGVFGLGFHFITKLRKDANMKFLFHGPHPKRKGPRTKYGGKVKWNDNGLLSCFHFEVALENGLMLYSQVVYSVLLKRKMKVVVIVDMNSKSKTKPVALLASTNLGQSAYTIYNYYTLRFQIEFIFRDAKQHLGLNHCQSIKEERLDFHFNISLMILNLAKMQAINEQQSPFSIADIKTEYFNERYLERIIALLDLQAEMVKLNPNYSSLRTWGKIAA